MAFFTTAYGTAENFLNPVPGSGQQITPGYGPLSSSMNINPYQQGMFSNQYVQPQTQWGAPASITGQPTSGTAYAGYDPSLPWYLQSSNISQFPFLPGYNQTTTPVTQPVYQQPVVSTDSGGDSSFPTTENVPEFQGWDALGNDLSNLFGGFSMDNMFNMNPGSIAGTIFGGPILGMLGGWLYDQYGNSVPPELTEVDPTTGETIYPSGSYVDSSGAVNWGDVSAFDPNYVDTGTYGYTTIDDIGVESPNYSSSDSSSDYGSSDSGGITDSGAGYGTFDAGGSDGDVGVSDWGGGFW